MLRILIADDHDVVRHGLRAQFSQRREWDICAEARNGREAVKLACELRPDIVVMDLSMPELNGVEATRQIRHILSNTEILVFTRNETEQMIRQALSAGARGYVLKRDAEFHLTEAIEIVARHKPYFTCRVSDTLLTAYLKSGTNVGETSPRALTPREREIVQMLTEGNSNKEVASLLHISVKTVETHRSSLMRKLSVNSIVELVHYAIRNHIVEA
jgi:DNA-binding NarL/FixJ family response regulator